MKYLIIFAMLLLPAIPSMGQSPAIDDFFTKYKQSDDAVSLSIGRVLIHIGSWFIEDPAARSIARKAKHLRLLSSENQNMVDPKDIEILKDELHIDGFESLMTVRSEGSLLEILGRDDRDVLRNLILLMNEEDEFALVSIKCKMTYDELQQLISQIE